MKNGDENDIFARPRDNDKPLSARVTFDAPSPRNLRIKSEGSVFSGRKMSSPKSVKVSETGVAARSWRARPILSPEFTEASPPLQEVYVGVLRRRKDTSTAIQSISAILPCFAHLKRCTNGRLLLAPLRTEDESSRADNNDVIFSEDQLRDRLKGGGFDLNLLEDKFQVTQVPARTPRTKSQAGVASKIWPVNFHPDQMIERLLDGTLFDEECLRAIERIMSLVIEAARLEAFGDRLCTGAAAIVDPEDGRILTIAAARIDRHPMWHAAMLAVDLVARLHGGGAWRLDEEKRNDVARGSSSNDVNMTEAPHDDERSNTSEDQSSKTRLKMIKRRYEEDTPLCYPRSLASLPFPAYVSSLKRESETRVAGRKGRGRDGATNVENATSREEEHRDDGTGKRGPYLCTGYWAFLLTEPCPLCAMALLHSRVARIFYGAANPRVGVLGSRTILHTVPGLNHRYRVWSGVMERECRQMMDEIDTRAKVVAESSRNSQRNDCASDNNAASDRADNS